VSFRLLRGLLLQVLMLEAVAMRVVMMRTVVMTEWSYVDCGIMVVGKGFGDSGGGGGMAG